MTFAFLISLLMSSPPVHAVQDYLRDANSLIAADELVFHGHQVIVPPARIAVIGPPEDFYEMGLLRTYWSVCDQFLISHVTGQGHAARFALHEGDRLWIKPSHGKLVDGYFKLAPARRGSLGVAIVDPELYADAAFKVRILSGDEFTAVFRDPRAEMLLLLDPEREAEKFTKIRQIYPRYSENSRDPARMRQVGNETFRLAHFESLVEGRFRTNLDWRGFLEVKLSTPDGELPFESSTRMVGVDKSGKVLVDYDAQAVGGTPPRDEAARAMKDLLDKKVERLAFVLRAPAKP